jgi:hypothetical protein
MSNWTPSPSLMWTFVLHPHSPLCYQSLVISLPR